MACDLSSSAMRMELVPAARGCVGLRRCGAGDAARHPPQPFLLRPIHYSGEAGRRGAQHRCVRVQRGGVRPHHQGEVAAGLVVEQVLVLRRLRVDRVQGRARLSRRCGSGEASVACVGGRGTLALPRAYRGAPASAPGGGGRGSRGRQRRGLPPPRPRPCPPPRRGRSWGTRCPQTRGTRPGSTRTPGRREREVTSQSHTSVLEAGRPLATYVDEGHGDVGPPCVVPLHVQGAQEEGEEGAAQLVLSSRAPCEPPLWGGGPWGRPRTLMYPNASRAASRPGDAFLVLSRASA